MVIIPSQMFLLMFCFLSIIFPIPGTVQYRVAQNKIPHQTMCNISATSEMIFKILEAA